MGSNAFADQYLCQFTETDGDQTLRRIAENYVRQTEAYDRTVCTGPIGRDGILPATAQERSLCSRNATRLMQQVCAEYSHLFNRSEISKAIGRCNIQVGHT